MDISRSEQKKLEFIDFYKKASNAATGSKFDSNANITSKNIATLQTELGKKDIIDLNRIITYSYIEKLFGKDTAEQYLKDLSHHIIYTHDESSLMPYCCSISLYPYLISGLKELGGSSLPPKHANSFIGGLINLVFLVAGQFAGAVAIPEFLTYFDHFLRVDYGEDYIYHLDEIVESVGEHKFSLKHKIEDWFQQFVYSINQPAGARNYQSPFTNIAYFDKYYFDHIFGEDFVFPDGDAPRWETTKELQKMFMKWFNNERLHSVLTFPVETANILVEDGKYKDEEMADFFAEMWAEGHSFFMYQSDSVDALASCCRLRNAVEDNSFSFSLGAGAIETGSKRVCTLNINRIVQDWAKHDDTEYYSLPEYIERIVKRVHKYLRAWNQKLHDDFDAGILTVYKAGFIDLDKQFLTIGINGFVEAAEFLGIKIDPNEKLYRQFAKDVLGTIKKVNIEDRDEHHRWNTEFVPAENLAAKNYKWDKEDGYVVPSGRNLYNSYFYIVEDRTINPAKKFYYQGHGFATECDGGVALHNNLEEHLSKEQYRKLMDVAVDAGCNYFTYNIPGTRCVDCGHISKRFLKVCPECGGTHVVWHTRIIGYMREVSSFSEARQEEFSRRYFATMDEDD